MEQAEAERLRHQHWYRLMHRGQRRTAPWNGTRRISEADDDVELEPIPCTRNVRKNSRLGPHDARIVAAFDRGEPLGRIAGHYGVCVGAIAYRLRMYGRSPLRRKRMRSSRLRGKIAEHHRRTGLGAFALAHIFNVSKPFAMKCLREYGCGTRRSRKQDRDREIARRYIDDGLSSAELAEEFRLHKTTVIKCIRDAGRDPRERLRLIEQEIQAEYEAGSRLKDIAAQREMSYDTIRCMVIRARKHRALETNAGHSICPETTTHSGRQS